MALDMILYQGLYRGLELKAMVWNESVVGDQPVGHFAVELGEVGKQEVFVVVDETFLDGAVEAFGMGVHWGGRG